jgi:hypothetical protein
MNYKTRALRNLILSAATMLAIMFVSQAVQAQCVSSELKDKWRAGRYQEVRRPLQDCFDSQGEGAGLELEYMLAKTWCNLSRYQKNGCDAYRTLKSFRGRKINVNGSEIDLNSDACCRLPEPPSTDSGQPGIGMTSSFIEVPKPFRDIVNEARAVMGDAAYHAESPSQITSRLSGRCLDVLYGSQENSALLVQYDCHPQDNQTWQLVKREDGYYNIIAKHSGKCLDVNNSSMENGIEIFQNGCHDGDNQRWRVVRTEEGYYTISAKHSGKCLDVSGSNQENLAHIVQWDCHGGPNQQWTIASEALGSSVTVGPPAGRREVVPARDRDRDRDRTVAPPPQRRRMAPPPPVMVPPPPM